MYFYVNTRRDINIRKLLCTSILHCVREHHQEMNPNKKAATVPTKNIHTAPDTKRGQTTVREPKPKTRNSPTWTA